MSAATLKDPRAVVLAPVVGACEYSWVGSLGEEVVDPWPHGAVVDHLAPVRSGGGAKQDSLALQRLWVQDVNEGLEEPAVGRAENRADCDDAVRSLDSGDHPGQLGRRIAGHEVVCDIHGEVPQFHHLNFGSVAGGGKRTFCGGGQLGGAQAARRR